MTDSKMLETMNEHSDPTYLIPILAIDLLLTMFLFLAFAVLGLKLFRLTYKNEALLYRRLREIEEARDQARKVPSSFGGQGEKV
ncbi:hypothetical protein COCVIDRAFT_23670 [Bipolaris victoriae FI3]|uniref:Uncharacterized protein n=1 Tax=Bipolaris victoriae (strain FI3) TaxID=930091 RepID=W7EJ22_BIPV3|nr:hypothetical protein COCVIDRAFT_23670 [Bipolaris victoriae FI3]